VLILMGLELEAGGWRLEAESRPPELAASE